MLDQITKALPPYTWLTSIAVAGGSNVAPGSPGATAAGGAVDSVGGPIVRAWITGGTVDIQAYTTFLRQLAASPWLPDVTPATSSTIDRKSGVEGKRVDLGGRRIIKKKKKRA